MTFSLAARCAASGRFGIVVSSSSPAVAARCAHARAGVGAAASQNVTDPSLGSRLLDLLASGLPAPEAMAQLVASARYAEFRQLTCVDAAGRVASHSGERTLGRHAAAEGVACVAAGNLLADEGVPEAMVDAFEEAEDDDLGDRLVDALIAGVAAGGEEGEVRSAGLLIVDEVAVAGRRPARRLAQRADPRARRPVDDLEAAARRLRRARARSDAGAELWRAGR